MCTTSSSIRVVRKSPRLSAHPVCGMNTVWPSESCGSLVRCPASAVPARSANGNAPSDAMTAPGAFAQAVVDVGCL